MQAVVLVGGLGTRLKEIINNVPKSMALIDNKPFLYYLIEYLKLNSFNNILFLTGYKSEIIEEYCRNNLNTNIKIGFSKEFLPLGTAGALFNAWELLDDNFFLFNGDSLFNINLNKFFNIDECGIFLKLLKKNTRYGIVNEYNNKIISFAEKENFLSSCYINAGVYKLHKLLLQNYFNNWDNTFLSLEKDIFPKLVNENKLNAFKDQGDFIDIGVVDDFQKAQQDIPKYLEICKENIVINKILTSIQVKNDIIQNKTLLQKIIMVSNLITETLKKGHKIFIAGNGGSAADAQHIAAEFVSRFYLERKGLSVIALTVDTSILTAIANDYNFERIFTRQLEAHALPNDMFIAITTSGNSKNIINAVNYANNNQIKTVAFTGENGGEAIKISKLTINIPSNDTPRIQECHITIAHIICEIVEKLLY